jgi:hypothetical protein
MRTIVVGQIWYAFLACLFFVVLYWARSNWRVSPTGRNVMLFMFAMIVVFGILVTIAARLALPLWVYAVGFGVIDVAVTQRVWLLIRAQRGDTDI